LKSNIQRWFSIIALLALLVPILAACGGDATPTPSPEPPSPTPAAEQPTVVTDTPTSEASSASPATGSMGAVSTTIRLGYVPVMIFAPLYIAQERGYFTSEGLNVELTPVQGGSDSVVQLAAGNFDAVAGGFAAGSFNAANQGLKFTIVAPMHQEKPPLTTPLVISAKRSDEIKSVADLKGKKVSINATGAATEYWLDQALTKNGLTMDDIQLTALAFRDVPAALENGSLDAAMLGEPLVTINEDKGIVKVLAEDFINGFTATYLYMGEPLLTTKPEAARSFLRAYMKAIRDLQGNYLTEEVAKVIEKYTQVPAAVTMKASPPQYDPNGKLPLDNLNTLQDYFMKRGELEYTTPLDITKFVDQSLVDEVVKQLDAK
jgi:NitT/TauT family transport system substrate-binding protein